MGTYEVCSRQRLWLSTLLMLLTWNATSPAAFAQWQAGLAKADITPKESVPLAGYGGKTRMSQRVEHAIWLKALALRDDSGKLSVLVTADLVGLSDKMVAVIAKDALETHGLSRDRLILNSSHNHSCPVTEDVLWLYYELNSEESLARDRYTAMVYQKYREVIAAAIAALEPAELTFEQGLAGIAVNRRRARGPASRSLGGPVDHDVPVLVVKAAGKIKGILFGYSCHTTALGGLSINGDYAGFAQIVLERQYPEAVAMFMQNCGGDANPLPRIRGNDAEATSLASKYGDILAEAVRQVIASEMKPLSSTLRTTMGQTELPLQPGPTLDEVGKAIPKLSGMQRREFEHFLGQYEMLGALPDRVNYPIQVWQFGKELTLIALTGETVVDYSLKFKAAYGWNSTWVCGYNNDLLSYVPSLRVLREGDYEGSTGMFEYGHRAAYTPQVEELITSKVDELFLKLNPK